MVRDGISSIVHPVVNLSRWWIWHFPECMICHLPGMIWESRFNLLKMIVQLVIPTHNFLLSFHPSEARDHIIRLKIKVWGVTVENQPGSPERSVLDGATIQCAWGPLVQHVPVFCWSKTTKWPASQVCSMIAGKVHPRFAGKHLFYDSCHVGRSNLTLQSTSDPNLQACGLKFLLKKWRCRQKPCMFQKIIITFPFFAMKPKSSKSWSQDGMNPT